MEVVQGPTSRTAAGITYQVTLASGMIVTNPQSFGPALIEAPMTAVVVTESGRVFGRLVAVAPGPINVEALGDAEVWRQLRGVSGWEENAQRAREQAEAGQGISLKELRRRRRR